MSKARDILDLISEVEDKRPPKGWFDDCLKSVSKMGDVKDPARLCGWIYHHHMSPEAKKEAEKTRA